MAFDADEQAEGGGATADRLNAIRERLCNGILIVGSGLAVPAIVLSLMRISLTGVQPSQVLQVSLLVVYWGVTLARHRLPYWARALPAPVFVFIAGAAAIHDFGVLGAGYGVMAVSAVLATVLLGRAIGMVFIGLAVMVALALYWMRTEGLVAYSFDPVAYLESSRPWINRTVSMALMALFVVVPIAFLIGALYRLVGELEQSQAALARSNRDKDAAITELTALKHSLERRVEEQTHVLRQAKEEAEAANRAKTDFLSVISHELRSPLTVVLGYSKALAHLDGIPLVKVLMDKAANRQAGDGVGKDDVAAVVDHIRSLARKMDKSGGHLLSLINDLLDFAKIEAGKMDLHPRRVPMADVLASVLEQMEVKAQARGLVLDTSVADGIVATADETRLRQILINLIDNAVKFTSKGGVFISVDRRGDAVECRVRDTGPGIPDDQADAVFDRFRQLENSLTRTVGGTGLGLAITKRLVEAHGGEIHARNHPDGGAEFTFTLPCAGDA